MQSRNSGYITDSSNRSIVTALTALAILVFTAAILTAVTVIGLLHTTISLSNSYHRLHEMERFFDSLQDGETGQRGFILTGNESYLQPYNDGVSALPQRLNDLEAGAKGTPFEADIMKLRPLADEKLGLMADSINVERTQGPTAALAMIQNDQGKVVMDQIRAIVSRSETAQSADLDHERSLARWLGIGAFAVGIITLPLALVLAWIVYRLYRGAMEASRELDRAKDEFVSLASHQLRTPATGIKSILSMLAAGDFGTMTDKQQYYLGKALESNDREIAIIEELLNVAKADAGRLVYRPTRVDLSGIIRDIVGEQRQQLEDKRLNIILHLPAQALELDGDGEKLYMAIGNLLDNARKYTPDEGSITVNLQQRRGWAYLEVVDTGIGIPEADIGRVFDRFQRARDALTGSIEGTGLGLYLVRRIVELHNGTIEVHSKPGHGSRFVMNLPTRSTV